MFRGGDVGKALNTSGGCVVASKGWRDGVMSGLEWCLAGLGVGMWVP